MKFSIRQSQRAKGAGYWISPSNHVYKLADGQSHAEWVMKHQHIFMANDPRIQENDPDLFEKVFYDGWIRVRIEFDSSDNTQWIASVSALNQDLLSTLPEDIKDIIMTASKLEFIDMPNGNVETFDKSEMERFIHRKRYASFIKIKHAILNPMWTRYPYENDLKIWHKLLELIQGEFKYNTVDFFDNNARNIDRLYDSYVRTKNGGSVDPRRSVREKFLILSKGAMIELEKAIIAHEENKSQKWQESQERYESLDAKLEREKGEYEARNSSLSLSFRERDKTN